MNLVPKTRATTALYSCLLPIAIIVASLTCAWHEYRLQRVEQATISSVELRALHNAVESLSTLVTAFNHSYEEQSSMMTTLIRSQNELLKNQVNINQQIDGMSEEQ